MPFEVVQDLTETSYEVLNEGMNYNDGNKDIC